MSWPERMARIAVWLCPGPRSAMVKPATLRAKSVMFSAPELRICSCEVADTENGVSCTEPVRFCAVTTISSSVNEVAVSAARAGRAASADTNKKNATVHVQRKSIDVPPLLNSFYFGGRQSDHSSH